jgi:hypothetical protein
VSAALEDEGVKGGTTCSRARTSNERRASTARGQSLVTVAEQFRVSGRTVQAALTAGWRNDATRWDKPADVRFASLPDPWHGQAIAEDHCLRRLDDAMSGVGQREGLPTPVGVKLIDLRHVVVRQQPGRRCILV